MPGSSSIEPLNESDEPRQVRTAGPPWILGRRGAPREAPENTVASFRRALALGADGLHTDVRCAAGGDLVVFADEILERTTDGVGRLSAHGLVELSALDAGGWYAKRFTGEALPVLDELLEVAPASIVPGHATPLHWVQLEDTGVAGALARHLRHAETPIALRVAARDPQLCKEAADAGLPAVYCTPRLDQHVWELAREAPLVAVATRVAAWEGEWGKRAWPCERWGLEAVEPNELLRGLRGGLSGVSTAEVARAVAARSLVQLAPEDTGAWPLELPELALEPDAHAEGGAWRGRWHVHGTLRNPFPFAVRVALRLEVRRGAFDSDGLPAEELSLGPGAAYELEFDLRGGSWSPGGDPRLHALFEWDADALRAAGRLSLDAPLARRRHAVADVITRRLSMLREGPHEPEASMTMRRRGSELHVVVENAGGLLEPRAWVRFAGEDYFGGGGVRLRLPADFDTSVRGVEFACGFLGRSVRDGRTQLRRFGGGLEWGSDPGATGRLHPHRAG